MPPIWAERRKNTPQLDAQAPDRGDGSQQSKEAKPTPGFRKVIVALLLLLAAFAVLILPRLGEASVETVTLNEAIELIDSGAVAEATIDDNTRTVTLTADDSTQSAAEFPDGYATTLTNKLLRAEVPTSATAPVRSNFFSTLALSLIPMIIIIAVLVWLLRAGGMGLGGLSLGKRGEAIADVPQTRFSDVAGADEAVEELAEMVDYLKDPTRFEKVGATPPKGALLVGPPGTGKTLLARAVAGESGATFYEVAASDFVEIFAGAGARKVRELFTKAEKDPRAIIFIDEIDAVGRSRNGGSLGSDTEREQTLVQLLTALDGFKSRTTLVLAATNRPEVLDPALTRPGRLDRQIQVPLPDRGGRERILRVHSQSRPVADTVDFVQLARRTPGFSGAELAQLVNEASMEAGRRGKSIIDMECFNSALAIVALGRARTSAIVTDSDREITAWHEAGHALVALLSDADDPVHVSITPRGPAGGVTWMGGSDDVFLRKSKAHARLQVALAGRAAEMQLLDGDFTSGAHGDLTAATDLARSMVASLGMGATLVVRTENAVATGSNVGELVDKQTEQLLEQSLNETRRLLGMHREGLRAVAMQLLAEEDLSGEEVRRIHDSECGCRRETDQISSLSFPPPQPGPDFAQPGGASFPAPDFPPRSEPSFPPPPPLPPVGSF